MVRILGHYISLRAILFAVFETAAFTALFNVFKVGAVYLALGQFQSLPHQGTLLPIFCALAFMTSAACGMYNRSSFSDSQDLIGRLLTVSVLMYFLMAATISVTEIVSSDSTNYKLYYAVTLGSCAGFYVVALLFRLNLFSTDFNDTALERRILVVGADDCAAKIAAIRDQSRSPFKPVGFVPVGSGVVAPGMETQVVPAATIEAGGGLQAFAEAENIDEIVFASREQRGVSLEELFECKLSGIAVTDFPSFWERQTGQIDLNEFTPNWLVFSRGFGVSWQKLATKRLLDILASVVLLIIALPVLIITAVAIRLESAGPILYRQERVGLNGKRFTIFKFRSMSADAEKDGVARWAQANDSRVTRVGAFIRKTRIDEIPQAFNILMKSLKLSTS